jgi:RNA binding exosome subunit
VPFTPFSHLDDRFFLHLPPSFSEGGNRMTPLEVALVQNTNVRKLCKSVLSVLEEDNYRMKLLLDELYRALDERELLASLF